MAEYNMGAAYNLRSWRNTIDQLAEETGIALRDVCEYTGTAYNEDDGPSFYVKLPRKRTTFIGIGMAFKQPPEVINGWITRYAGKKMLYAKDIGEDLVWLYLINANLKDETGKINYYLRYEEFQSVAYAVFCERWDEIVLRYEDTADIEISLGQAEYGPEYDGIKAFVAAHIDAFKTAYQKPRAFLDDYVSNILRTSKADPAQKTIKSLNSMRGYLDDSMVNFLCGDRETINVLDRHSGRRTIRLKHMPKGRRFYLRLCLALGMTAGDINRYLDMMGYAPLDVKDRDESRLISALTGWENSHPLQRIYKDRYIYKDETASLSAEEEYRAVREMLQMRSDLIDEYKRKGFDFIYS